MPRWTRSQVEQFAPDDRSIKAAQKLARPGPWSDTGSTDTLVWGKCQGRGATPYQVSVDLTGPAVKCSCPSRKFPCKHGLALLMLWIEADGAISDVAEAADFAADWARDRSARAERSAERMKNPKPVDPEAAAKRLAQRLELMTAGAAEFETWLGDLYRNGFAAARQQGYGFWEAAAARLTDSQLPGLAQRVRDLPADLHGADWVDVVLVETGRLYAAARAWQRHDELAPDDLANLRAFVGWAIPTAEVRAGEPISDTWSVAGVHRSETGRLHAQRTWLYGETTGGWALMLDFAAAADGGLRPSHVVGSRLDATLGLYPGSGLRRALFIDDPRPVYPNGAAGGVAPAGLPEPGTIDDALGLAAENLSANPFADQQPMWVRATVAIDGSNGPDPRLSIVDPTGASVAVDPDVDPWPILAQTGTDRLDLFGEWHRGGFWPLSARLANNPDTGPNDNNLVAL